jgi:GntR family transcriptional repressor for pyruvate dehydrogenase complex
MSLKKIEKQSIVGQVSDSLKQEILNRNFEVGDRLPSEAMLSKQFGVSKATVKIALQRLATLGLIETQVGQGSFVRAFDTAQYISQMREFLLSDHDIDQITEYRLYVEMVTTRLAIKRAGNDDFRRMEELLRRMDEAIAKNDVILHGKLDYEFHLEICRATGNKVFVLAYEIIDEMLHQHTAVLNGEFFKKIKNQKPGDDIHWKLLEAIKKRNIDACRDCYIEMFSIFKKLAPAEYLDS